MQNEVKLEYYGAKDITTILGVGKSTAYEKIKEFNTLLKEKYPNVYTFDTKIPIWFWDELTKPSERSNNDNN